MANIATVNGRRCLQLFGEDFVRRMPWGSNWESITLAYRFSFGGITSIRASDGTGYDRAFRHGLQQGTAQTFSSPETEYYIGTRQNSFNLNTVFTPTNTPPTYFAGYNGNADQEVKIRSTRTSIGVVDFTNHYYYGAAVGNTVGAMIWNVTKTRGATGVSNISYAHSQYAPNSAAIITTNAQADPGVWHTTVNFRGQQYLNGVGGTAFSVPYNISLDTVSLSWVTNTSPLNIFDLLVMRVN